MVALLPKRSISKDFRITIIRFLESIIVDWEDIYSNSSLPGLTKFPKTSTFLKTTFPARRVFNYLFGGYMVKSTSFPGSLILSTPGASEERP